LRRTRSGKCTIANATSLEKLAELGDAGNLSEAFQDVTAVIGLETVTVDRADELRIRNGVAVKSLESEDRERALLCSENGALLAVAELDRDAKQWRRGLSWRVNSRLCGGIFHVHRMWYTPLDCDTTPLNGSSADPPVSDRLSLTDDDW
jgi:tRNA U55 pseudouridine synthase TruB